MKRWTGSDTVPPRLHEENIESVVLGERPKSVSTSNMVDNFSKDRTLSGFLKKNEHCKMDVTIAISRESTDPSPTFSGWFEHD